MDTFPARTLLFSVALNDREILIFGGWRKNGCQADNGLDMYRTKGIYKLNSKSHQISIIEKDGPGGF